MRARTRHLLLLVTAAALIGGCAQSAPGDRAVQPAEVVPPIVSVAPADAVKTFDEGIALVADLEYEEAADRFSRVVNPLDEAGDKRRAAEAIFWFAYCREKLANIKTGMKAEYLDSATKLYERLIEYYPKSAAAARATKRLGALEDKAGKL